MLLDERVTFRRITTTQNDAGTLVKTTVDYATVWASIKANSGDEQDYAQQTASSARYTFTIRNRRDLTEADFIAWRGDELNIRAILDQGPRALYLTIEAERGAIT